ncbi:ShlB/FhaC/HecB family hemolysin secretion/activation protein [Crateriforma conspicua]|uniref:Heme/hemopexin transporter protein HuxB n=1 Tax=Crateriforma conspicua TaxID=2527996 RepID=A0A5C6G139_9PLAN|nr:ShlB/FhaC/HecB family hemolysin secretion/activation protein [Crateriforma conspicua]TWU67200.1 Heme/hemopexin transporter protein HuxB precursor [Crateriforma conspicua]
MKISWRRSALAVCLVAAALVTPATQTQAQNYERYKPLSVPSHRFNQPTVQPESLAPVEGSDKVLVDALAGVIILDHADKVDAEDAHDGVAGIQHDFDDRSSLVYGSGVQSIVYRYLDGPVTLRRLNQMSRDIITYYRKCGQPVVDVVIPEQKITSGVVQIVVTEARIGSVTMTDGCVFEAEDLCHWVQCTRRGDKIFESKLNNDLFWLNQNPFRRVSVDMRPGDIEGTTDIIFDINDVCPIRVYSGYEDTGVRTLGLERLYAGMIYGNAFGKGGILSYQYTADAEFYRLNAHSVSYAQPVNRKISWNAYGSWAGVTPTIPTVNQDGESWQLGMGITHHLQKTRWVDTNWSLGVDFKQTNNNLEFGGQLVQNSAADLIQLRLSFQHLRRGCRDQYGLLMWDSFVGPGAGFTGDHNTAAFNTIRANTTPDYFYTRLRAERLWNVQQNWQLMGRFVGQLASERLLFSETLGFGGYDSIRGYDQRVYSSDDGWFASLEFGPRMKRFGCCSNPNTFRAFTFVDMGSGSNIDPLPGEFGDEFLISMGLGMRLTLTDRTSLRASYGHGFEKIPGAASRDRVHIGFVSLFGPRVR